MLILHFLLEAAVIVVAGSFLVRFGDRLGARLGIGQSMAGMLFLAIATSLPELLVAVPAARIGAVDLVVGNMLGSSLFNLLILAVLDMFTRTRGRMLSRAAGAHALSAVTSILMTSIVLVFLLLEGAWSLGRLGAGAIAIGIAYMVSFRLIYLDQRVSAAQEESDEESAPTPLWRTVVGYALAALAILVAAPLLARTADRLADQTGLGETFVGTVFVALVTSLPELSTTLSALRRDAVDMAIGNVLGSNSFNIVILLGADLAYEGPIIGSAAPLHAITAAAVIGITCVLTQGLLYRVEKRYWLVEPDAAAVIVLVLLTLWLLYSMGVGLGA